MPSRKKKLLKTILKANIAGCGCGRPKLSDVYEPTPKPKAPIHKNPNHHMHPPQPHSSPTTSCDRNGSFTVNDDDDDDDSSCSSSLDQSEPADINQKINGSSAIAVVKDSNDPYQDFRQSMLQMIVEKQIYSKKGLQELLSCFLQLNSKSHHHLILQAFTQIWNDLKETNHVNPTSGTCQPHPVSKH